MNNPTKDKKKWGGLGNILHKDRPTSTTDSTYGSEGSRESYNSATAPTPSLTGSDTSRNAVDNQGNQVVTTTTTTTTTTTSGAGGSSTTSGPHGSNLMNKLDPRVDSSSDQTEVSEVRRENAPGIPARNQMRERSPNPPVQSSRAQEYGSPTTSGSNNFSYPGRAGPAGGNGGTLEGLKQAAVGIHVCLPYLYTSRWPDSQPQQTGNLCGGHTDIVKQTGRRRNATRHAQQRCRQAYGRLGGTGRCARAGC